MKVMLELDIREPTLELIRYDLELDDTPTLGEVYAWVNLTLEHQIDDLRARQNSDLRACQERDNG